MSDLLHSFVLMFHFKSQYGLFEYFSGCNHSKTDTNMKKSILLTTAIVMTLFTSACCSDSAKDSDSATQAVLENIANRKSVRSYKSDPIPGEMVEKMLRAGMSAPTAMNRQPWAFVVVDNPDTLKSLAGKLKHAKMLEGAPLAIIVCAESHFTNHAGISVENMFWQQDCAAATENILLAAEALGLGAVWTAASDPERSAIVRDALGMEPKFAPFCVIPIGYPAGDEKPKDKWKPEKIHYNKW